ncbi:MAG: hypothetical protein KDA81_02860 [Planctomycetaceae bacterium]|nr:hypothetical protein [Planctomycetaceae bacterium]
MWLKIQSAFVLWTVQLKQLLRNEVVDLEPHEYCIGATFVIAIAFVLLSGRR